ncbi:hypothetical protein [Photobacterium leiognathi]|uniref:hypothetical protein n=1 Tax=Photobacterium leiognathi TaxID=553611 RepID=UPI002981788A|nr:hypothetical protein [Photobacterium leiognathi]
MNVGYNPFVNLELSSKEKVNSTGFNDFLKNSDSNNFKRSLDESFSNNQICNAKAITSDIEEIEYSSIIDKLEVFKANKRFTKGQINNVVSSYTYPKEMLSSSLNYKVLDSLDFTIYDGVLNERDLKRALPIAEEEINLLSEKTENLNDFFEGNILKYNRIKMLSKSISYSALTEDTPQIGNYYHTSKSNGILDSTKYITKIPISEVKSFLSSHNDTLNSLFRNDKSYPYLTHSNFVHKNNGVSVANTLQVNNQKINDIKTKIIHKANFYYHYPLTEDNTKKYLKTVVYLDKVNMYCRDYFDGFDKQSLKKMIDTLHQTNKVPINIIFNGKAEVYYGSAVYK